jgi:hypothetical protein
MINPESGRTKLEHAPASSETTIYILLLVALLSAIAGVWLGPLTNVLLGLAILAVCVLVWRATIAHKKTRIALLVLEAFLVSSTLAGGVGILKGDFGLPASWLSGTAFSDYAVPGVMLLVVCAISVVAAATLLAERESAVLVSVLAGVFMAGNELVEMACIDTKVGSSLPVVLAAQVLWFGAGFAVAMLAGVIWRTDYHKQRSPFSRVSHA